MGLGKNNKKSGNAPVTEKTTVIVQPVALEKKDNTPNQKLNRFGQPYANGKKVAAHVVSFVPTLCAAFSAGSDAAIAAQTIMENQGLTKKDKAKIVTKTILKIGVRSTASIIAGRTIYGAINDTFDLNS